MLQNIVATAVFVATMALFYNSQLVKALSYCPPDWKEYNYACFYFNKAPLTWTDAETACGAMVPGAHLAQPRDSDEYQFIQTLRTSSATQTPWIGARFNPTFSSTAYVGLTGAQWPSTNYNPNPPTLSAGNCAQIKQATTTWQGANCTQLNPSICMFYTMLKDINPEMFVVFNRLYGAMDWYGNRNGWNSHEDGQFYNVSLTQGPTGSADSAIQLNAATKSYVAFVTSTNPGVNYQGKDFYFMFYLYRTVSPEGPIIQYRYNQTHYGFNIWSMSNGSMLIDLVKATPLGPVTDPAAQVFVPETCAPLNQWNFITVHFFYSQNGILIVRNGGSETPCVQVTLGQLQLEMSRGFDIGRRQMPTAADMAMTQWPAPFVDSTHQTFSGDTYFTGRIACLINGENNPAPFYSGEAMLWCQQALQETTLDKSIAKRQNVLFPREENLVGMWPLNDFYKTRDAVGRVFYGEASTNLFGFGPWGEINGSLVFDGESTFVTLNAQPNQAMLAPAFTFVHRSFTISTWFYVPLTKEGGPIASFQDDTIPSTTGGYMATMVSLLSGAKDVKVHVSKLGGRSFYGNLTFPNCVTTWAQWHHLAVVFDYPAGTVSVYVDGTICGGGSQTIGATPDIEAPTNIIVGRSSYGNIPFDYFKGKMACFSVHSDALTIGEIAAVKSSCQYILAAGVTRDNLLFKPQHLRWFLPLGRGYDLRDVSGREMHGMTRGFLGTSTGPLGHPHSATRFYHEPNSAIDIQSFARENPFEVGTNDSVTYLGYLSNWPNRDGNLPYSFQSIIQHWDQSNGGRGFYVGYQDMNSQLHFSAMHKNRYLYYSYPSVYDGANTFQWQWFVFRYSKVTRKITVILNGNTIHDETFGWALINTFSALRIGAFYEDTYRFTGKMACMMMYDIDLRDDEIAEARDMCHRHLIRAYGPPVDTTKCYHSSNGWEYKGKVSWTVNGRKCASWFNQTTYTDPTAFPDESLIAAGSYCRNPELGTNRTQPWCYTTDPLVSWEYCNIPICEQKNVPFHDAENLQAFWPMGKKFGGADVSGHAAHARVGSDIWQSGFTTGPFNITNGATKFTGSSSGGNYLVQYNAYFNVWDLLDFGYKTPWMQGYSYTIFAYYPTSITGNGVIWSWESSNGDGGNQGLQFRFNGNAFVVYTCDKSYRTCRNFQCPSNLIANTWYQLTFVYNRAKRQLILYQDTTLCYSTSFPEIYWDDGIYTVSGSFKIGGQMYKTASGISAACAALYTQVLTPNDLAAIRSKCKDILSGIYDDYLLGATKPTSLWPLSSHTEGLNTRSLNHARYSMATPVLNQNGIPQAAFQFPGNNMQYFWAAQDYLKNLDVCQMSRSFTMTTWAKVQSTGTAFAFHTTLSNIEDNNNAVGRGNQLAFMNTQSDVYFSMNDGANLVNPIKNNIVINNTWVYVTVTYDFRADNLYIYHNNILQYSQVNVRGVYCQTSGSVSLSRAAFRPLTLGYAAQPLKGALSCAQLYSTGMLSEGAVQRSQRFCSHPDYIGCYPAHNALSSDFNFNPGFWDSSQLTVTNCRRSCGTRGYRFAALRNGETCLCGHAYGSDGPETPEGCNVNCPSSTNEICGGVGHLSVYRTIIGRVVQKPRIRSVDYTNCMPGWKLRGGQCYRVFINRLSMTDAVTACASYGAQLASITDNDENSFVASIVPTTIQSSDYICLGANSTTAGQSKAVNMDRKPFFYANWASGQPSQSNYWVCMLYSNRLWYAQNPSNQLFYACKKPGGPFVDAYSPTTCALGWTRYLDSCYAYQDSQVPYRVAQSTCNAFVPTASLAKIESLTQFKFVQNLTDWQHPFWIGLEYSSVAGDFVWVKDGTILDSTSFVIANSSSADLMANLMNSTAFLPPWAGDHRFEKKLRRCVVADSRTQYDWRSLDCESTRHHFVCQYDLPSTSGLIGLASGRILASQLNTSDTVTAKTVDQARVGSDSAWCADNSSVNPWISLELSEQYRLYEMWFQGNPSAVEYVKYAMLEYSNNFGVTWTVYSYDANATYYDGTNWVPIISANSSILPMSTNETVLGKIAFGITGGLLATNVRITVLNYTGRPCLRLEFKGTTLNDNDSRKISYAFKPIRFELDRLAGSSVRYTVYSYVGDPAKPLRWSPTGIAPETVLGTEYIYRPRHIGRQKIVFAGIDAEETSHELTYEISTVTRLKQLIFNMCPTAVLYNRYAACEFRIVGGSAVNVTTDYIGLDVQGPRTLRSMRYEIGQTTAPSQTLSTDASSYVYLMPNQGVVRQNTTVYAIEAVIKTAGWITIQIYKPYCASDLYFCPISHSCLFANATCRGQRAFDSYKCPSPTTVKAPWNNCTKPLSDETGKRAYFDNNNPKLDYQFVTEWRKYFTSTGSQVAYLDESEQIELTLGMVMAYYRSPRDDGVMQVFTSSALKEYYFLDSASGFSSRLTSGNFTILRSSATQTGIMHMVKLITQTSIGVSFSRKWGNGVDAGTRTVNVTVQDVNYPATVLQMSFDLEVQSPCIDFSIEHEPIVDANSEVNFTVPDHNGTKCFYKIDFGDGSNLAYFDYLNRDTISLKHIYKLDGVYNVTLYAWNLVYSSGTFSTITVTFPIQQMSMYMANPPANEVLIFSGNSTPTAVATGIITFAQASGTSMVIDVDANKTLSPSDTLIARSFASCPDDWVNGATDIGVDACYRYFHQYSLSFDRAQSFCASHGASLAYVNSAEELGFLKDVMIASGGLTVSAWIGYSQLRDGFNFWVSEEDKSSLPSFFWQEVTGQYPVEGGGSCGYYDYATKRMKNDNCNETRPMICKRETAISKFCGPVATWVYDATSNRCFNVSTQMSTYLTAVTACRHSGGKLVVPESQETFDLIKKLAQAANPAIGYYMGLWRPYGTTNSSFRLYDGWEESSPSFTNWDAGQPTVNQGENCVTMRAATGVWKAVHCNDMGGYICEKPVYGTKPTRYFSRTASRRYIVPVPQPPSCPVGWVLSPTTLTCYKTFSIAKTWDEADDYCLTNFGGHLAKIHTFEDHTVFWSQASPKHINIWFGLYQRSSALSDSTWRDGSPTTGIVTTRWGSGQPNVFPGYAYYPSNSSKWRVADGTTAHGFACSKPAITDWKIWAGGCPNGYAEFSGRCFRFETTTLDEATALASCQAEGGGLATISSQEDLVFLRGMFPLTANTAWIGLTRASGQWEWEADVRGKSPVMNFTGMWSTPSSPPTTPNCGVLTRSDILNIVFNAETMSCSSSHAYICEQPAAVCPPGWKIWAGSCYRVLKTPLRIQPGTDFDTAKAACQYEDSLPVSPVNHQEHVMVGDFVSSEIGTGAKYGFGYRRLSSIPSKGFIDLSGRLSYFSSNATGREFTSGSYCAYGVSGSNTIADVQFSSDIWVNGSVCQSPTKLSTDLCLRECLATPEFNCKMVHYTGTTCQFSQAYAADDWYGLRETYGQSDLYLLRKDICPDNLVESAFILQSTDTSNNIPTTDVTLNSATTTNGFLATSPTDMLLIRFSNSIWLNALVLGKKIVNSSYTEYVKTFHLSYTFDREHWNNVQGPSGTDLLFSGNDVDDELLMIKMPRPILLKAMKIVPVDFVGVPSYRLRLIGCHAAVYTDYADYRYSQIGGFAMAANAYSSQNNASATPINVYVQSKVTNVVMRRVAPLPYGSPAKLIFDYYESLPYSNPLANATFDGRLIDNVNVTWKSRLGVLNIGADYYLGVGQFPVLLTLDSLVSDPVTLETMVFVDYGVANLTLDTNATEDHGAEQDATIELTIMVANCSRCNITINFGTENCTVNQPADSSPWDTHLNSNNEISFVKYFDYIASYENVDAPTVAYHAVTGRYSPFVITVVANNLLENPDATVTATYEIFVERQPDAAYFNYTASQANKITPKINTDGSLSKVPAPVTFCWLFTGYMTYWPTAASYYIDFQDGTANETHPFTVPTIGLDPATHADDYKMAEITHAYTDGGVYSVQMWVVNRVGKVGGTAFFIIDEDIYDLKIVPTAYYVTVGSVATFNVVWKMGTRFQWQVEIFGREDNSTYWTDVYNSSTNQFKWIFNEPGTYLLGINASSFVTPNYTTQWMDSCCPIVVQYPVTEFSYRLTANPSQGKLSFDSADDELGHAATKLLLWENTVLTRPTSPFLTFDYGDGTDFIKNQSVACSTFDTETIDGQWRLCLIFPKTYQMAGEMNAEITISNLATKQTFSALYVAYVNIFNLAIEAKYTLNPYAERISWIKGYPATGKTRKSYSESFFPTGYMMQFIASAKMGETLRYCFFSSIDGNLTDCSKRNVSDKVATYTFNYDTPCGGRLERCGIIVSVVAFNPADTATASMTIYLQKPLKNMQVVQYGPSVENATYPLYLRYDQLGTDTCVQADYGTPLTVETGQTRLFGSEYMCSEMHGQGEMTTLKAFSKEDISSNAALVGAKYSRRGSYKATVKAFNFVSSVNLDGTVANMTVPLIVTKAPCGSPLLFMETKASYIYKKDEFRLPLFVKMNCTSSKIMVIDYAITFLAKGNNASVKTNWVDIGSKYFTEEQLQRTLEGSTQHPVKQDINLVFPARSMNYGTYVFKVNCIMTEEIGLNASLSYQVNVVESDLVVGLTPSGSRRDLVYGEEIQMNAYNLSYDPDVGEVNNKVGLRVYYFCKRECDGDWPVFTNVAMVQDFIASVTNFETKYDFSWTPDDRCKSHGNKNLTDLMFDYPGCFFKNYHSYHSNSYDPDNFDFPSLNQPEFIRHLPKTDSDCDVNATSAGCNITLSRIDESHSLLINSNYQYENMTYNLMAIVVKDTRFAIARQTYRLEPGSAPQAVVTSVTNCAYSSRDVVVYNPTSRASFRGLIQGRIPGVPHFFNWILIKVPSNVTTAYALDNMDLMADRYTWPSEHWIKHTSTGKESDDLSINTNFFNSDEYYGQYYMAYVEVYRGTNPRRGVSSLLFVVNKPPNVENATCTSNHNFGYALNTTFQFACTGIVSDNGPLTKFVFSMQTCSYCPIVVLTPTIGLPELTAGVKLPAGVPEEDFVVTIYLDAIDNYDSMSRVKFEVTVLPHIDFETVMTLTAEYATSIDMMIPQDMCQQMYIFSTLMNVLELDPVYMPNKTAYYYMNEKEQAVEDEKVEKDQERYDNQLFQLATVRDNITTWLYNALAKKGLQKDANRVRTCCHALTSVLDSPEQAKNAKTLDNAVKTLELLSKNLTNLASLPTRDADRFDETSSACVGVVGKLSSAMHANLQTIRLGLEDSMDAIAARAFEARFGNIELSKSRSQLQDDLSEAIFNVVFSGKVLRESPTLLSAPGMKSNLQKTFVRDMNNTIVPTGGPDDCGCFRLGDAAKVFARVQSSSSSKSDSSALDRLLTTAIRVKSSMAEGNHLAFDSSADSLNGQVQTLQFIDSSDKEIAIKDLPFEIEITLESTNQQTPDATQLTTITNAYPREVKAMSMNVSSYSALFISVSRWNLPNMCDNSHRLSNDVELNATCSDGNVTTLLIENVNYTVPSLNVTDEEVIFFVYVKYNETPTETNYDLRCTLPRLAFENEVATARGQATIDYYTTPEPITEATGHTTGAPVTTAAPTTVVTTTPVPDPNNPIPECSTLTTWNVSCCDGSVDEEGICHGQFVLPTTPVPTMAVTRNTKENKNCARPSQPDINMCFFDHRQVSNATDNVPRLYKIGIRAIPRSLVRSYVKSLLTTNDTSGKMQLDAIINKTVNGLITKSVRAGYKYHAYTASCKYFDPDKKTWSSNGCRVGDLSTAGGNPSLTQCFCNHLTSFTSSFDVPINVFDPRDSAFTKLDQNPICFTFGICIFCIFFSFLIWARKRDKEDERKWGTAPLADNDPRDKYAYEMTVWTGQHSGSGTSARVSFMLRGDEGDTPIHVLENEERNVLQRNGIDSFLLLTPQSLGRLVQLRIWHDNSGSHPNWYFSRMQIHDLQRNKVYYFLCERWLALDEDDGQVERIMPVASKAALASFQHLFLTKSRRRFTDRHVWISVFSRPPLSTFTRCQRLTCCLSILYSVMVANIMFFGIDKEPPGITRVDFGPISMSTRKIFMSLVTALVIVPVNLTIVQLFRMSKHRPTKQEQKIEELRQNAEEAERNRLKSATSGNAAPVAPITVAVPMSRPMSLKAKRRAERLRMKQKKVFKLPWWCIIVGYCLAAATCGAAFWAVVEYGGSFGPERALQWVVAMFISLVFDFIILQPLQILIVVTFYALVFKSPVKDEDVEDKATLIQEEAFLQKIPTEEEMMKKNQGFRDKRDYVFLPPDPEELKLAREIRLKEKRMWKILKETGFFFVFLYLLLMVAYGNQDDWAMYLQKHMRRVYHDGILATPLNSTSHRTVNATHFNSNASQASISHFERHFYLHEEDFNKITQETRVFTYLERTLIPSIFNATWYNGDFFAPADIFTRDQTMYLAGSLRIRQLRVRDDICRVPAGIRKNYTKKCITPYSKYSEETRNFTAGWELAPVINTTVIKNDKWFVYTNGDPQGFAYKTDIEDGGMSFTANLATYSGGGYIVDLGRDMEHALATVAFLKQNRWIDDKTRAIFLEFNLYCPNRNLWAISQSVIEFFAGGSTVLYPYFYVAKIDAYFGTFAYVILAFELLTLAIVIWLFVREVQFAIKYKQKYWTDPWSLLELGHLLACLIAALMLIIRYAISRHFIGQAKKQRNEKFANFTLFITYNEAVQVFMGCIIFVAFMRLVRLLRFNRRISIVFSTLKHVRFTILLFFVIFFVVYLAFAQLGYLSFGPHYEAFSSFTSAIEAVFTLLVGKVKDKEINKASCWVGPIFFIAFAIFVNLFLVNAFLGLLMLTYEQVRSDTKKQSNDNEIVDFVMSKIKVMLGFATQSDSTTLSIDKRYAYLDSAAHEDEIDRFTARMDELMTKLDLHLEKTKTQFAAMFDQRFLARKQREVYTTD